MEKLIEERRQQFQQQKDQELEERREEERRQAMRHAIIEQERQRLLREHASKLLGYLPKVYTCTFLCLNGSLVLPVCIELENTHVLVHPFHHYYAWVP